MNIAFVGLTPFFAATPGWVDQRLWLAMGWTMVHFLWVGTAIGLAAWGLRWLLRWWGPQVRYVVSVAVLLGLAAAPVAIFRWQLERIPVPASASVSIDAASGPAPISAAPTVVNRGIPPSAPSRPISAADALYAEANAWLTLAAESAPWIWAAGAPLMYILLGCGLVGAERLRRRSRVLAAGDLNDSCQRLRAALRISRPVAVAVSQRVIAPMLVGVLRPLILLPAAMLDGQSAAQIEMILLHELAHVRRWDNLVNLAQRMIEAALFFHPAVWLVSRWVRLEREHCCDEVVLAHSDDPRAYAETLAALAIPGLAPAHAAAVMANHQLLARIRHILNLEDRGMTLSVKVLTLVGSLVVTTALLVAAHAQSNAADPNPDAKPAATSTKNIDASLAQKLEQLAANEKFLDDAEFLRRLTLDVAGNVPSPQEIKQFAADTARDKRAKRVEELLAHQKFADRFAQQWKQFVAQEKSGLGMNFISSTTIGSTEKRPWGPEQATGAPDSTMGEDTPTAWASLTPDGQDEWLELSYAEPVDTVAILVYENLAPGALAQAIVYSADQPGLSFTWTGADPTKTTHRFGISVVPLRVPMKTKKIRLIIDSKNVPGWNEIDAVGLLDRQGQVHWATSARASSTFADQVAQDQAATTGNSLAKGTPSYAVNQLVIDASQVKQPWSAAQATGPPDAEFGTDSGNAWASQNPDGGEEWLKLEYEAPVKAVAVLVYESFNPGAVRDVIGYDSAGKEFPVMTGRKPDSANKSGILSIALSDRLEIATLKLTLDTKAVPGWNEIDAVGILDAEGKVHWAKSATASSSYGEPLAVVTFSQPINRDVNVTWWNDAVHQSNCLSCHTNAHQNAPAVAPLSDGGPDQYRPRLNVKEPQRNDASQKPPAERELERYRLRIEDLQKTIDKLSRDELLLEIHSRQERDLGGNKPH